MPGHIVPAARRQEILDYISAHGNIEETARRFNVSTMSIRRWADQDNNKAAIKRRIAKRGRH